MNRYCFIILVIIAMLVIVACGESTKTVDGKELMTYQEKYPNGQIKIEYTYILDEHGLESRQGELRKYASNGQLIRRSHFKDSKLDGLFEEFDDQISSFGVFLFLFYYSV